MTTKHVSRIMVLPHSLWLAQLQRQHPRAQKLWTSTTVHGSLESFQTIDLPFCLAVAPRLADTVPDRVNISAQCACEPVNRVKPRLIRGLQPSAKFRNLLASWRPSKSHGKLAHRGELGPFAFPIAMMRLLLILSWRRADAASELYSKSWLLNGVMPGFDSEALRISPSISKGATAYVPLHLRIALLAGLAAASGDTIGMLRYLSEPACRPFYVRRFDELAAALSATLRFFNLMSTANRIQKISKWCLHEISGHEITERGGETG